MQRTLLSLLLAVAVAGSVWWVQAPPRSETAYRESAEETIDKLRSRGETARLWIEEFEDERVFAPAVAVAIEESDRGAASALSKFEGYDPPRGLEPLRTEVASLGSDLTKTLGDLRVAVHEDRWARASELADRLPELSVRLEALSARVEP